MKSEAPAVLSLAFDRWLDAQRQARELVVASDHPGTPEDWAEGHRWAGIGKARQ